MAFPGGNPTPIGVLDVPVELLFFPSISFCGDSMRSADSIAVRVMDPSNQPVEAEGTLDSQSMARVRFTPRVTGAHHVSVLFEPYGGLSQQDVPVGVDRSSEPSWTIPGCSEIRSLSPEALLCDGQLYRSGRAEGARIFEGIGAPPFTAVGEGHVWLWDGLHLSIWRDEGAGPLILVGSRELVGDPAASYVVAAAANGRHGLLASAGELWLFGMDSEGTPEVLGQASRQSTGSFARAVLDPERAWVLDGLLDPQTQMEMTRACAWELTNLSAGPICHMASGSLRDASPEGFVTEEPFFSATRFDRRLAIHRFQVESASRRERTLNLPQTSSLVWPILGVVSSFSGGTQPEPLWMVAQRENEELRIEQFWRSDLGFGGGATVLHAWAPAHGNLRVWKR